MTHFRPKSSKGLDIPMDEIYVVLFGSRAGYVEAGHQSRVYFGELAEARIPVAADVRNGLISRWELPQE